MTELEKLANKYADAEWENTLPDTWPEVVHGSLREGYIAGFKKAREVAAQCCDDIAKLNRFPGHDYDGESITNWFKNAENLRRLGESEVTPEKNS